ncbi:hypothetical protein [Bacillus infantis]|uniref:hypothetical protein n=1 Tax=Bacillus infantis TaxID=324767 RepID=UPI0013EC219B|nr:hypothetical protein [Bacillus infantis]
MYYIYVDHLSGKMYSTNEELEDTYCEQCGDSDWLHEVFDTEEEADAFVAEYNRED